MDMSLSELRQLVMDREAWRAAVHGVSKSRTQLSDWTELIERGPHFLPPTTAESSNSNRDRIVRRPENSFYKKSLVLFLGKKKNSIEFATTLLLLLMFCFLAEAWGNLSSLTRDWTHSPCIARWSLHHWTTGEVLPITIIGPFIGCLTTSIYSYYSSNSVLCFGECNVVIKRIAINIWGPPGYLAL